MEPENEKPKRAKTKNKIIEKTEFWLVRVLVVFIPAFFTYKTATYQAEAEAEHVEKTAAAGYDELVEALKHLDNELTLYKVRLRALDRRLEICETRNHVEESHIVAERTATPVRGTVSSQASKPSSGRESTPAQSFSLSAPLADAIPAPEPAPEKVENTPLEVADDLETAAEKRGIK